MYSYVYGLVALIILFRVFSFILENRGFKQGSYYKITHNSMYTVKHDSGKFGEYETYRRLKDFEKSGAKFLFNCYLPREKNETTEIDVLLIHNTGIYVFESKNYSGWIFGNEKSKTWTQTLPQGRTSHKEHFLNPIMQNNLHIKWLKKYIGDNYPIHNVIVFSERCTLKKIELVSNDIKVIKRYDILNTVNQIGSGVTTKLTDAEIQKIYDQLYPLTQVDEEVKIEHIAAIKKKHA